MAANHADKGGSYVAGVYRYPTNGIKVVVVGGGPGGLQAALECWRKGCEVTVLERSDELLPIGDFFTISPSGLSTLKHYPGMYTDYHEAVYDCAISIYSPEGGLVRSELPEWRRPGVTHAAPDVRVSHFKRRSAFSRMQRDELLRLGVPIRFGRKVIAVQESPEGIVVETASGERFEADVCVAADGIGSYLGRELLDGEVDVQDSGYATARVAFPRCIIDPESAAAELLQKVDARPEFRIYAASNLHLGLMLTKDWVAWVCTHKNEENAASESWHNLQDADVIIARLEESSTEWDPAVISFLKQTPTKVVDWKLMWRDGVERWTSGGGRFVKLGDAAHSFLPTSGNGANQALEDAISLGECLRMGGKSETTWATKVHNKLRFERTSVLQQVGVLTREELHRADLAALEASPGSANGGGDVFRLGSWVWNHRPEQYAREHYHACLAHVRDGAPFSNSNLPPGHVYQPWSLKSEYARMKAGIRSGLKENGYWGM